MLTHRQRDRMRACVHRGADLLDLKYPTWFRRIDQETLDLSSCSSCVAGQLAQVYCGVPTFSTFAGRLLDRLPRRLREMLPSNHYEAAEEFGFDWPTEFQEADPDFPSEEAYRYLEQCWERQIRRRLRAAETVA